MQPVWRFVRCVAGRSDNEEITVNNEQCNDLLQQMHETELGGVKVYETALTCVLNDDLKEEWQKYLEQTKRHVEVVLGLMDALGVVPRKRLAVWWSGTSGSRSSPR